MKKLAPLFLVLLGLAFVSSCTTVGVARLPDTDKIFLTTASEDAFVSRKDFVVPYQPLGLVEYFVPKFAPFSELDEGQYRSLEQAINQNLVKEAQAKLGADAVINLQFTVTSTYVQQREILLQLAAQPIIGIVGIVAIPFAALLNFNIVRVSGLAVKAKK